MKFELVSFVWPSKDLGAWLGSDAIGFSSIDHWLLIQGLTS